jgi:hypothetical protein
MTAAQRGRGNMSGYCREAAIVCRDLFFKVEDKSLCGNTSVAPDELPWQGLDEYFSCRDGTISNFTAKLEVRCPGFSRSHDWWQLNCTFSQGINSSKAAWLREENFKNIQRKLRDTSGDWLT